MIPRDPLTLVELRYAFRIYDCDDDGKIGKEDLQQTLQVITNDKLEPEFMTQVVEQVHQTRLFFCTCFFCGTRACRP